MIRRREPAPAYSYVPCSMVAVATATGVFPPKPEGLREDGYLSLDAMNRFLRAQTHISKMRSFRRGERPTLKEFLEENTEKVIICVLGHYLYADGHTYWSFLRNAKDPVVKVWYLK